MQCMNDAGYVKSNMSVLFGLDLDLALTPIRHRLKSISASPHVGTTLGVVQCSAASGEHSCCCDVHCI